MQWSKEPPTVDGVYWWRADRLDFEPDIHSVVNGQFYEVGEQFSREVEGFGGEWLGPITPEQAEQFDALRKAAEDARAWICRVCNQYAFGADDPHGVLAALRRALGKEQ